MAVWRSAVSVTASEAASVSVTPSPTVFESPVVILPAAVSVSQ